MQDMQATKYQIDHGEKDGQIYILLEAWISPVWFELVKHCVGIPAIYTECLKKSIGV